MELYGVDSAGVLRQGVFMKEILNGKSHSFSVNILHELLWNKGKHSSKGKH